jgi:hypothetical protein
MQVGVNYPWLDYGWDFGLGPPRWRGSRTAPRWAQHIDDHLAHLRGLGISVVRWFILADGLTYGTDDEAPRLDPAAGGWRFEPPALDQDVVDDFDELLRRFERTAIAGAPPMQLLPVLVDFHFGGPGMRPVEDDEGWVKEGRVDAIRDPDKCSRFLSAALEPLLAVSADHREVVYAWELINEPDWITDGWHPNPFAAPPVPEHAMRAFLEDGNARIRAADFESTIGFASIDTLFRSGMKASIDQFHYYPDGRTSLPRHPLDPRARRIIGEFATSADDVWPDLIGTSQEVASRLRLASERGYPLALPWSFLAVDRHTAWSPRMEEGIRAFTRGV